LKTTKGAEISEAANVTLKNVRFESKDGGPVVSIENSTGISIDGLKYADNAPLLFNVMGDRAKGITVTNTDVSKAKNKVEFKAGADDKSIVIK